MAIVLNEQEKENLKNTLLDFVLRVASDTSNKWQEEVNILPAITKIITEYFD